MTMQNNSSPDSDGHGRAISHGETLYLWEVHLVYNRSHESPSDETMDVVAPDDRDAAIEKAREQSRSNPPHVGPTYRCHEVPSDHYLHPSNQEGGS